MEHVPVLLKESADGLQLSDGATVIDATINGGGHTREFLKRIGIKGHVIGIDWDREVIKMREKEWEDDPRVTLINSNFSCLEKVAGSLIASRDIGTRSGPDAIFFDLGLSSFQLNASGRGFSFSDSGPLTMTIDPDMHPDLKEFIQRSTEEEIANVIWKYGEERRSRKIARAIKISFRQGKVKTASDLAKVVSRVQKTRGKIHAATKTFQAFRIYLNHELENLDDGLKEAFKILRPGGRIAVICFHSLEDRIVKNYFKNLAKADTAIIITKKPIRPNDSEIKANPRSRSAKLRILEKI